MYEAGYGVPQDLKRANEFKEKADKLLENFKLGTVFNNMGQPNFQMWGSKYDNHPKAGWSFGTQDESDCHLPGFKK